MAAPLLSPLAAAYGAAVSLRSALYRSGLIRTERAPAPVISVGNLVAGGTGKTPVTALVARILQEAGERPAILSRGYGGRRSTDPMVVSDGRRLDAAADASRAGDEPVMLARLLPGVPVVVGRRRAEAARLAVARLGAWCLVLDDGFQHLALERDLDLVLLDSESPLDNGRLLPAGMLRERPSALARADAVVVTGPRARDAGAAGDAGTAALEGHEAFSRWLRPGAAVFRASLEPTILVGARDAISKDDAESETPAAGSLAGSRAVAFAGIARPERLAAELRRLGADVAAFLPFPDHHVYGPGDIAAILEQVRSVEPDALVTTEKDLARLRGTPHLGRLADAGLVALRVEAVLGAGGEIPFRDLVLSVGRGVRARAAAGR